RDGPVRKLEDRTCRAASTRARSAGYTCLFVRGAYPGRRMAAKPRVARSNLTNGGRCRRRTAVPSATVRRNDELVAGGVYFSVSNDIGTVGIASEAATLSRSRRVWRLLFRNAAECGCVRRL